MIIHIFQMDQQRLEMEKVMEDKIKQAKDEVRKIPYSKNNFLICDIDWMDSNCKQQVYVWISQPTVSIVSDDGCIYIPSY